MEGAYSVYPYACRDDSNATGATPGVLYPTEYNLSGATDTYAPMPMMAINNTDGMDFYHVGGLVRFDLAHVPDGTVKLVFTFVGIEDITGRCTVTNPGTKNATTAIATGMGNTVTFINYSSSLSSINLPLPTLDFSDLTSIQVEAFNGTNSRLAILSRTINSPWRTFKHAYARIFPIDFTGDLLDAVRLSSTSTVTLWRSETALRTAKALYSDGMPYRDATIVWSSADDNIATVDSSSGEVTATGAGSTTITATATAAVDGRVKSASYTVVVNEITGVSLASSSTSLGNGEKAILTATITHTNITGGEILGYPTDMLPTWESSNTSHVSVSGASSNPAIATATTGTATATATGGATAGTATLTVTAASKYCKDDVAKSGTVDID